MRNLSQSGSDEQGEEQRFKGIFRPKSEIQAVFTGDLQKQNKGLLQICKGFSGRKQVISKKKEKFLYKFAWDFPAEIRNSSGFSGRKWVISKKRKKGLHPKNVMISGVSPQKTPIWASICTPVAPSLLISSGHSPRLGRHNFRLGGTSSHLGGAQPGMPPVAPGLLPCIIDIK